MRNIIWLPTWICLTWIHIFGFGVMGQTLSGRRYTGTSDLLFYSTKATFNEAMRYCSNHNSVLVKASDVNINNAIIDFNKNNWNFWGIWIGATDMQREGAWKWVAGGNIGYTNWGAGEPNDGGDGEDCAYIREENEKWNDAPCNLKINFVCQKEFNIETVYEWQKHIFTFHVLNEERKTFAEAFQNCAAKGSRLVEISTRDINAYLKGKMRTFSEINIAWTGGSDLKNTNTWRWNNRTYIDTSRTKWGWRSNEPNGAREHCLAVSKTGWMDFACNTRIAYICEQVQVSVVHPSSTDFTIGAGGGNKIKCDLRRIYPQPTVSWYFEGNEVAGSSPNSVYQTKAQAYATLNTQHATITDEGSYTCRASNTIGGAPYTATGTSRVKVPSRPSITSVTPNSCSLRITWAPNKRAVDVEHRISISNGSDNFTSMVTPTTRDQITNVTRKLTSSATYYVEITPCPNECKTEYSVSHEADTDGPPGKVRDASVVKVSQSDCNITWKSPSRSPSNPIAGHKIYILESIASLALASSENTIVEETRSTESNSTYLYHGKPNRKYSFGVQAVTCDGAGFVSNITETCTTDKQAPSKIPKPTVSGTIDKEGKAKLSVPIPDQKNGPLSCLFVMVNQKGIATGNPPNSLKELLTASESTPGNEYIAVALTVARLTGSSEDITLGDGAETICDVHSTSARKRRSANKDGIFVVRNTKLDPKTNYSVYAVSATPSGDEVFIKSSDIQSLHGQAEIAAGGQGGSGTIIAVIIVLVVILALASAIIVVVLIRRRRSRESGTAERGETLVRTEQSGPSQAEAETVYQNSAFHKEGPRRSETEIPMTEFGKIYKGMMDNDGAQFLDQFQNIVQEAARSMGARQVASNPALKKKNRYKNILPFDTTRVVIKNNKTGYINACFVNGFKKRKKFIATQGPLPGTVEDFWLMVVEQRCSVIVMLAKCFEAGKNKCAKYWPEHRGSEQYGPVKVTNNQEIAYCGFMRRTLEVAAVLEGIEIKLTVSQYHFSTWPDHGVPLTTSQLMSMHREVMRTQTTASKDAPIIVHCSAGAGRTGTFVGYDFILEQSKKLKSADVYNCVLKMREQRVDMVQNCDQYILVHKLLLEAFLFGDTDMTAADAMDKFEKVDYRAKNAANQFKNLSKVQPVEISFQNTTEKISTQGKMKVVIVRQEEDTHQPTIDASFVECYDTSSTMIASRAPTEATVEYFWRAILTQHVSVIVMLNSERKHQARYFPSEIGQSAMFGHVNVTLQDGERGDYFETRKMSVVGYNKSLSVTHLQFHGQMDNFSQSTGKRLIKLVEEMQKALRQTEYPIALIHCSDGAGNTGTFCAVVNLIERLKVENRVDVFRVVKDLRDCRPGMVSTLDQYILCHQAVIDFLNSFDIYSNFR